MKFEKKVELVIYASLREIKFIMVKSSHKKVQEGNGYLRISNLKRYFKEYEFLKVKLFHYLLKKL